MFILCNSRVAKTPYEMPYTKQKIYSLEELCYYLYHNVYSINEEFFQESLVEWLKEEIDAWELAEKMEHMLEVGAHLKDFIVTILCGCDYYKENEVRQIVEVIDGIANLPLYKKKKIKADNYLRAGYYGKSLVEYRKLLHGSFAVNFTTEEYGEILHNQGIAHFYTSAFLEAEKDFKEAYARNNNLDSLKHYLWLLLMQEKTQMFETESIFYGLSADEMRRIQNHYQEVMEQFRLPEEKETDLEQYKQQLKEAFLY